jgi:hypothetical protein
MRMSNYSTLPRILGCALLLCSMCAVLPAQPAGGPVIPRVRDTLDAYAWKYFGLVPAWKGVTSARFERTEKGFLLHARTSTGDSTRFLSFSKAGLLSAFLCNYEEIMRGYTGSAANDAGKAAKGTSIETGYLPLINDGLVGLRNTGYRETRPITTLSWHGERRRGILLYALDSTLVLRSGDAFDCADISRNLCRIHLRDVSSVELHTDGDFSPAYWYGAMLGFAFITTALTGGSDAHGSTVDRVDPGSASLVGVLSGLLIGVPVGVLQLPFGSSVRMDIRPGEASMARLTDTLSALRAYAAFPPPEVRSLFPLSDSSRFESDTPRALTFAFDTVAWSQAMRAAALSWRPRIFVALDWGLHFYNALWKSEWGPKSGLNGAWTGFSLNAVLPVFNPEAVDVAVRPHAGYGFTSGEVNTNSVRAGIDITIAPFPWMYILGGIDYHTCGERFSFHYLYGFNHSIDQSRFIDGLFIPLGVGYEWHSGYFEVQYRIGLGTPLHTEPPPYSIYEIRFPPSEDRPWRSLLLTYAWRLW